MSTFVINPGHCGCETGAISGNFIERELNLTVAKHLADMLSAYDNVKTVLTRTANTPCNNVHISSGTLIKDIAAQNKADAIISIHHNAGGGIGSEVYYQTKNAKSKSLAQNMISEYTEIGRKSRGIKNGDAYRLLNGTSITTVMSEYAFVDNKTDRLAIDSDADLKAEAKAICTAIVKTYGLKLKQPSPAPSQPETPEMYRVGTGWSNGKCVGQKGAFEVKQNALRFCDQCGAGYSVFDSKGNIVYSVKTPTTPQKGDKVTLNNANLYSSSTVKNPTRQISGTYYLYDGKKFSNNRYRITVSPDMCGKTPTGENVTGYVDASLVGAGDSGSSGTSPAPSKPYAGMAVKLSGAKLYGSASAATPANTITGTYYLYDGENISGRYRITTSKDRCGKTPIGENVTGFVDAACVKA